MLKMVQFYAIPFSKVVQLETEKRAVFIGPCILHNSEAKLRTGKTQDDNSSNTSEKFFNIF